ncbi:MAG: NADH-quinone oxidoreductase subunit C, partial [Sideroxydans sp.]|nr:NADH-quinone oxidoreductase subunit C [Sideroxydans sp.]
MPIKHPDLKLNRLSDALPAWSGEIAPEALPDICTQVRDGGGRLVSLWGSDARQEGGGFMLHVTLMNESGLVCLNVRLPAEHPAYPDISHIFLAAERMQRATYDLLGLYPQGGHDHRKWLRHGAWHSGSFPLRKDFDAWPLREITIKSSSSPVTTMAAATSPVFWVILAAIMPEPPLPC